MKTYQVWAPHAQRVELVFEPQNERGSMQPVGRGYLP